MATWWRVWGRRKDAIAPLITGAWFWQEEAWEACLKVLAARPRRRKRQQLPPEAIAVLYRCDASQQDGFRLLHNAVLSRGIHAYPGAYGGGPGIGGLTPGAAECGQDG